MILLAFLHLTLAHEIRLENLDNGPGILPFKLGQAKLVTHYHSFLQYIDLTNIEDRLDSVDSQLRLFANKLDNDTLKLYELQTNYLTTKLTKIRNQLDTLEPNKSRTKRGLIDGLGSVVKSITGNLDHTDAEKYDRALNILESNDDKLMSEFNEHISLNKIWISQHTILLTKIAENQEKINNSLALMLDRNAHDEAKLVRYAKLAQLLGIISENAEDLILELDRIENILAFIRASSTHHSMLSIDNLRSIINRLKIVYGPEQVIDADLREYYNIIKSGYYYAGSRIVIIFKIPIISSSTFEFYKLSLVPNRKLQTIIPPYPFLATNGKNFMYIAAECLKFNHQYLCEEDGYHPLRAHPDCIQNIINHQALDRTCRPTKVTLDKEAMEQLDNQHYTLVFPKPTKAELQCGRQEFLTLHGSYLATLPLKCYIRTEEFTIINTNDHIKGQPLLLTEIPQDYIKETIDIPHLKLNSINLNGLHAIEDKILMQHPVEINHTDISLYHTTLPLYGTLLLAAIAIFAIILRRYNICTRQNQPKEASTAPENHPYEDPEKAKGHHSKSATFSLRVLK